MIKEFQGEYRWLSNFWPCTVTLDGETYPSVEHAYQAAKSLDKVWRWQVAQLTTAKEAKRMGKIKPRDGWDSLKLIVMLRLVREKFQQDPFKTRLLATKNELIQEGNHWGDTFWGVDLKTGKGNNHLGHIIMQVREELKGCT